MKVPVLASLTEEQRKGAEAVLYYMRKDARDRYENNLMTGDEVAAVYVLLEGIEDAFHELEYEFTIPTGGQS